MRFLAEIAADADGLLGVVRGTRADLAADSAEDKELVRAAEVLARVLGQDIERDDNGPRLKQGVAPDRLVSVHDPEMRHGRKSSSHRFNGHKAQIAVDTDSQLLKMTIQALTLLPVPELWLSPSRTMDGQSVTVVEGALPSKLTFTQTSWIGGSVMKQHLSPLFWIEALLALGNAGLFVMTFLWSDWIEIVFRIDPDAGSGAAEWAIVVVTVLLTIMFLVLARSEWRRAATRAS